MSQELNSTELTMEIWSFNEKQEYVTINQGLIKVIKYKNYLWWCSQTFEQNKKFVLFNKNLNLKTDIGLPKCIIRIVELVNEVSFFNKEIRKIIRASTWHKNIFLYYNRYYRYLHNERLFGNKKFLNFKHGHKLHFISYMKNRELTGITMNKNFKSC